MVPLRPLKYSTNSTTQFPVRAQIDALPSPFAPKMGDVRLDDETRFAAASCQCWNSCGENEDSSSDRRAKGSIMVLGLYWLSAMIPAH